ncbi:MAG: DUF1616 domain-containing protein [Methanomicrobiaceae archaeon]|nr:DUF1616 domain-containing protein [Methanomicrobiaceae archaeon]
MPPEASTGPLSGPLRSRTVSPGVTGICPRIALALPGICVSAAGAGLSRVTAALPSILFTTSCLLIATLSPARSDPGGTGSHRTAAAPEGLFGSSASRGNRVLSIILVAALLVAIGTTVFIVVTPKEGEKFTEFYILGPKGKAADYPTEFMAGTPQTVIIGIGNHEYREVTYTVETFAVESRFDDATNQSTVVSAMLLDRFSVTVPNNQTVEQPYSFRIMDPDTNRLEFLLFKETPPVDLSAGELTRAGYRDLHLWLRVH